MLFRIALGQKVNDCLDYTCFFHLFLDSFISNLREALQEWLVMTTYNNSSALPQIPLLPGEVLSFIPDERIHYCVSIGSKVNAKNSYIFPGKLCATNYRIILFSLRKIPEKQREHSYYDLPSYFNSITIPLASIYRIYSGPPRVSLYLNGKDYRTVRLTFSGYENNRSKNEAFIQLLEQLVYGDGDKKHLFAYKYNKEFLGEVVNSGWNRFDIVKEYDRQGLLSSESEFRALENVKYLLSPTYPRFLIVPKQMNDKGIFASVRFRSQGRFPVVTYLHKATKAVLVRCAQPLVGLSQKNCEEDSLLLNWYRLKGKEEEPGNASSLHSKLYILDARGKLAATLNMAAGKGTEDVSFYQNTELVFGNIENIHVMRSSAFMYSDGFTIATHPPSGMKELLLGGGNDSLGEGYHGRLENAGWLRHLRMLLISSVFVAEKLHFEDTSVVVHCSDGW